MAEMTGTSGEVRVKDPNTGGEKGSKLARFDLIPTRALWLLAEVYGRGARKYADRNWERGYAWGLSIAALERHFNAWKSGESIDEETGCHHLAQVAWHVFTLLTFSYFGLGTDDRSRMGVATETAKVLIPGRPGTRILVESPLDIPTGQAEVKSQQSQRLVGEPFGGYSR